MKLLSVFYFSGTGNTLYVVKRLTERLSGSYRAVLYDVARFGDETLPPSDLYLFAFPVYGSSPPIPMREFVHRHGRELRGKRILIAETQYFFSGDGAASLGRTLEKYGGTVVGAEHFNMPNNLSDCKLFPIRNGKELDRMRSRAEKRIDGFAKRILDGDPPRRGFGPISHAVGYFGQRIFWRKGEREKRGALKIDPQRCVGCGLCAKNCPVSNLKTEAGKAVPLGKCAFCYRCVNLCPKRAITLVGSECPVRQYHGVTEKRET